jgi:hypothetical protein
MKKLFLLCHHGLGDELILNALVREYAKKYDYLFYFVITEYIEFVSFMFRDLPNIKFITIDDREWSAQFKVVNSYRQLNPTFDYIKIGHEYLDHTNLSFDEAFYTQANIPFEKRWSNFYVLRDPIAEKKLFDHYNVKENEYIFIHEDIDRNLKMDYSKIRTDLPFAKVEKNLTKNIFDYCYLIENAKEVHCIDSSFLFLVDSLNINAKLFVHRYIKRLDKKTTPTLKNDWIILN